MRFTKFSGNAYLFPFKTALLLLCVLYVLCGESYAQGGPVAAPETVGMSAEKLNQIDALVNKDIADKKLPGAVVVIGHKGKIVFRKAYGNRALVPQVEPMTLDTIFDVASLTKVVATTTSIMQLIERGELRLNDTIGKFFPEVQDKDVKSITVQQMLTHVSGFAPDFDLREKWTGREGMIAALAKEKLRTPPGTKFVYSDINFIVLGEIVQRLSGNEQEGYAHAVDETIEKSPTLNSKYMLEKSLAVASYKNVFEMLGLKNTKFMQPGLYWVLRGGGFRIPDPAFFIPGNSLDSIAPSENVSGQQSYLGGMFDGSDGDRILRGQVHDPTSYRMGGVAGHAGLFSTGDDLARFSQMLLNGGILDGKRVLSTATVARMTAPIVVSEDGATRGLGWDINTSFSGNRGDLFPLGSFGHTGFTGTSIWIDRVSQTFVVFLSNRVHPDGKGDVSPLRARIATIAASAVEDTPVEQVRLAENIYWSQVTPQIEKFKSGLKQSAISVQQSANTGTVLNGIDVLERDKFKQLDGMRVGLVTNHTGKDLSGNATIDILKAAPNVKLTALFAPEHGIRGEVDEEVSDSVDKKTGLPVYSLYGESRRPKPEQLKDLDALVFDIQDVGVRFYTYPATLKNVLEEAGKAKIKVFVLDRTNPIGGTDVEGPIADADKQSFVITYTTPLRHGMTVGEWATMVNAEQKFGAVLTVIKMDGWRRNAWFDQTGQTWISPSPNMRSLTEATLYPGIGFMEYTNISVGRGTDTPFEVVGAPWIDGQKLAAHLNGRNLPGVRFVPIKFKPTTSVHKGIDCGGINLIITDRAAFKPVRTGLEIAVALRKLYPNDWKMERLIGLLGNQDSFDRIARGESAGDIEKSWQTSLDEFQKRRARYLLY